MRRRSSWRTAPRLVAIVVGLGLLGACADAPPEPAVVTLPLRSGHVGTDDAPPGATAPPTVRVDAGRLIVLGIIGTPNPCHDLDAEWVAQDATAMVTVRASPRDVFCVAVLGTFAYRFERELPAGTRRILVAHEVPGTGAPRTVLVDTLLPAP